MSTYPTPGKWLSERDSIVTGDLDDRAWRFLCAYSGALSDAELADELEDEAPSPVVLRAIEMLRTNWRPEDA